MSSIGSHVRPIFPFLIIVFPFVAFEPETAILLHPNAAGSRVDLRLEKGEPVRIQSL
jgi:hypothetical protein